MRTASTTGLIWCTLEALSNAVKNKQLTMKMKSPDNMCSVSMEVKPKTLDLMQNYEDPCQSPTTCGAQNNSDFYHLVNYQQWLHKLIFWWSTCKQLQLDFYCHVIAFISDQFSKWSVFVFIVICLKKTNRISPTRNTNKNLLQSFGPKMAFSDCQQEKIPWFFLWP